MDGNVRDVDFSRSHRNICLYLRRRAEGCFVSGEKDDVMSPAVYEAGSLFIYLKVVAFRFMCVRCMWRCGK